MRPLSNRVVELKIPSQEGYEKIALEAVATIARRLNFDEAKIADIKTAIGEACTNAIRYGSGGDSRMKIVVVLAADEEKLDILIKDPGVSGDPPLDFFAPDIQGMISGDRRKGGMGLFLIHNLVDEAGFVKNADDSGDEGNQFRMVIYRLSNDENNEPDTSQQSGSGAENKGGTT